MWAGRKSKYFQKYYPKERQVTGGSPHISASRSDYYLASMISAYTQHVYSQSVMHSNGVLENPLKK